MRRDVGFYFEAKIDQVYRAYLSAATGAPFGRSCKEEPYHTITFGLNFSGKYNMNGGSCTIHLMPSGTGTAVNIRFSIAQLGGAHCERYAQDLHIAMQSYLAVAPRPTKYNMDDFLKPANQVTPASVQSAPAPAVKPTPVVVAEPAPVVVAEPAPVVVEPTPVIVAEPASVVVADPIVIAEPIVITEPVVVAAPVAAPVAAAGFCTNCGNALSAGNRFCSQCGTPVSAPTVKCCPNCSTQANPNALFCANCGTKL